MNARDGKPPIELIVGPAHSAKTGRLIAAFRDALAAGDAPVLILPTVHAASSLRTELLLDETFDFLGGPRILTFVQFAEKVLEREAPAVRAVEAMVEDELIAVVIDELARDGKIDYHAQVLNLRGFTAAVRSFLMELKRAEITPDDFEAFARRRDASTKDRELSTIYTRYQKTLQDRDLYDEEGRFWRARLLVSEGKLGPFADCRRLFLDAFYDFTPTQLSLVEVLARRGVRVTMTLPLDPSADRRELFESAQATLDALRERFEPTVDALAGKPLVTKDLAWLADHLFRTEPPRDAPPPDSVRLIETPGTPAEVREIAREIKRLHIEEHIPLERIAVVFRSIEEYRDVVTQTFDAFGIPLRLARGVRLSMTTVGQLVVQLLRVPAEGWHARDVMSLLKSNYVDAARVGLDDEGLSPARFETLVTEAGIVRGREGWVRNLRAYRDRIAARMAFRDVDPDDELQSRVDPEDLAATVGDLDAAAAVAEGLFACFDDLERASTTAERTEAVAVILDRLGVEGRILSAEDKTLVACDLEALAACRRCLDSLVWVASMAGETPGDLGEFSGKVTAAFADARVRTRGADFGRVLVCEVHGIRALAFDVVFIGGLLERSFPRMHREGPFYDDEARADMNARGLPLQPRRLCQREERFLFYLAVTRAAKRLYLSYPVTDREGKEKLVSYYVGEVKRVFEPHAISTRRLTLSTRIVGVNESASLSELRRAAAVGLSLPRLAKPMPLMRAAAMLGRRAPRTARILKRALEGEAERDAWEPFGVHDGVLTHPHAAQALAERFGPDHDFSVSRLEKYGCCPFAFFCESVLDVETPAEAVETIDVMDEGTLLHRSLRAFYAERRDRGDARVTPDDVAPAAARIEEIVEGHLDGLRRRCPDLNLGIFRVQRQAIRDVLVDFVRAEAARGEDDPFEMSPRYFEVGFGLSVNPATADPKSTPRKLTVSVEDGPPVSIHGMIDRIDVCVLPGGGDRPGFRVIDYKRTRAPGGKSAIIEGTALQMPIYLVAVRDVILAVDDAEPVDAQFYGLSAGETKTVIRRLKGMKGGIKADAEGDELIATALDFVREYARSIRHGAFPVLLRGSPRHCRTCEFRMVCRYTAWRTRKKLGEVKPWFEKRATGAGRDPHG